MQRPDAMRRCLLDGAVIILALKARRERYWNGDLLAIFDETAGGVIEEAVTSAAKRRTRRPSARASRGSATRACRKGCPNSRRGGPWPWSGSRGQPARLEARGSRADDGAWPSRP